MGSTPSGKGGERFPQLPPAPPKRPDLGGSWGGRPAATLDALWSGWSEGRKGRVGEKGPAAQDTVEPHALARQRLSVAPCGLAQPNGLRPANKNQYGLNLKYY